MASRPRYRHLVWDWNGTLLDDAWLCLELINDQRRQRGLPLLRAADYRRVFGFPIEQYYLRMGFDFSVEAFETVATEFIEVYNRRRHECALRGGALQVVQACHAAGLGQCVLSMYEQAALAAAVAHFGLTPYLTRVIGLDHNFASSKIDNGLKLLAELGVAPAEIVLVGDTDHDAEVAEALGIACLLMPGGHHDIEKLRRCRGQVVETFDDLLPLLLGD